MKRCDIPIYEGRGGMPRLPEVIGADDPATLAELHERAGRHAVTQLIPGSQRFSWRSWDCLTNAAAVLSLFGAGFVLVGMLVYGLLQSACVAVAGWR